MIRHLSTRSLVYVWGYNGYCRLGLGNQQDVLIPKAVPQVRVVLVVPREAGAEIT
jgi:alpha-tubulin suppressor-like RCC1 family protein